MTKTKHTSSPPTHLDLAEAQDPQELVVQRTFSILPAQLIQPDEVIILMLKPSLWFIPLNCLTTIFFSFISTIALIYVNFDFRIIGIRRREALLIIFAILLLRLFWQALDWLSRYYILTDKRVIRVKGITNIQIFETPLKNILHTQTYLSFTQQLFGIGSIGFATAATSVVDAYWLMINKPLEIHQIIIQALARYRK